MVASTYITNTEILAFIAVLILKLQSRKVLFINRKTMETVNPFTSVADIIKPSPHFCYQTRTFSFSNIKKNFQIVIFELKYLIFELSYFGLREISTLFATIRLHIFSIAKNIYEVQTFKNLSAPKCQTKAVARHKVFCKKVILKKFAKFTGKHLQPPVCSFIKKETMAQVFSS